MEEARQTVIGSAGGFGVVWQGAVFWLRVVTEEKEDTAIRTGCSNESRKRLTHIEQGKHEERMIRFRARYRLLSYFIVFRRFCFTYDYTAYMYTNACTLPLMYFYIPTQLRAYDL